MCCHCFFWATQDFPLKFECFISKCLIQHKSLQMPQTMFISSTPYSKYPGLYFLSHCVVLFIVFEDEGMPCNQSKDEFAPIGLAYNVEFVRTRGLYINDMKKMILHYKTLNN